MNRIATQRRRRATTLVAAAAAVVALTLSTQPAFGMPTTTAGEVNGHSPHPSYTETVLWDAATGPRLSYHVQALTVLHDDTILAFVEGRYEVCDAGPHDIELRRSTDGGATFSAAQVVAPSNGTRTFGNPTALYDEQTGRVFLFYNESFQLPGNTTCSPDYAHVFYRTSDDGGLTWSDETEITSLFADNAYGWTQHSPGPGHGIQASDGRLVLQVAHRREIVGTTAQTRYYGVTTIYSDDHGATWQESEPIPVSLDYPINESRIWEREDGTLAINGRYAAGGTRNRITAVSTDGGETWSDAAFDTATGQFVAIDAGFTVVPGLGSQPDRLVFSRPNASNRSNLTVSLSYDGGFSYDYSKVVNPGMSYYSDLAAMSDGSIVMLYGRDGTSASVPQRIVLARFNLAWLTNGADKGNKPIQQETVELAAGSVTGEVVSEPTARGGKLLRVAGAGGESDVPFEVSKDGEYRVDARVLETFDGGTVQFSVDGAPVGGPVDTSVATGRVWTNVPLGSLTLSRGSHVLTAEAIGPGAKGGWTMSLDELVLVRG